MGSPTRALVRFGIVAIGAVLIVVGGLVWYAPLQPIHDGPLTDTGSSYSIGLQAPLDVLGATVSFSLTWSSSVDESVEIYSCGTHPTCTGLTSSDFVAGGSGKTGTLGWTGKAGEYFAFVSSSQPIQLTIDYTEPVLGGTAGLGTLVFGGFLAALGIVTATPPRPAGAGRGARTEDDVLGPDPL